MTGANALARALAKLSVIAFAVAMMTFALGARRAEANNTCSIATGASAHVLCWLDMTGTGAASSSTNVTFTLPDGSTLAATVANATTTVQAATTIPTYSASPLGNSTYTGITGIPGFYNSGTVTIALSKLVLTDTLAHAVSSVTIASADDETLDTGDGTTLTADVAWTTTGTNWLQLQLMPSPAGGSNVCTLSGIGTTSAKCVPAYTTNNGAYVLTTIATSSQTVTTSSTSGGKQGFAFAVELSKLTIAKTIVNRVASTDQFTISIATSKASLASATTSGSATSASASLVTTPTDAYTLAEVAASGTLSRYSSTYACTNAVTSSTTLPSGSGTSVAITPAVDDQITCAFTNTGLFLTDVPVNATKNVLAGASVTDVFTLTDTSAVAGTFTIGTPSVTTSGGTIAIASYTFASKTYATVATLQAAIAAAGATVANGSISVGVTYAESATSGAVATVTLPAAISANGGTSASAGTSESDTASPNNLTIAKTGTTTASVSGPIAYSVLVKNASAMVASGAAFSDPMPSGLTIKGTPSCGSPTNGAACGTVTVSGTTVASTIATLPINGSVTFSITAVSTAAGSFTNTATVTPPSGTGESASSSSLTTTVSAANGLVKTVRDVTKGESGGLATDSGVPGDVLEYGLTFTNTTGVPLSGFSFSDAIPSATAFASSACGTLPSGITSCSTSGPAVGASGTVTWTFSGTLAAGSTLTATMRVTVT